MKIVRSKFMHEFKMVQLGGGKWNFQGVEEGVVQGPKSRQKPTEVVFIFRLFLFFFFGSFSVKPWMASTFRQSILRGGQCHFRCYCVNVSMPLPPASLAACLMPHASCHFPHSTSNPSMCTEWFLLLQLQTELVVHTFHSNFHLAILSGCRSSAFVVFVHFPRFFVDWARTVDCFCSFPNDNHPANQS